MNSGNPVLLWSWRATRLVLSAIFLYAGIVKASSSEEFALALVPFTIIPEAWTGLFAVTLAWTEVGAGVLILLPGVHRAGSAAILFLALLFAGVLGWALANDIIVSCGCFGEDAPPSASAMLLSIVRDAAIAAAGGFTLIFRPVKQVSNPEKSF